MYTPFVAVDADVHPVMKACKFVVRDPAGPPTRAPGLFQRVKVICLKRSLLYLHVLICKNMLAG